MTTIQLGGRAKEFIWKPTNDGSESLWAQWSRFCVLNRPSIREIHEILPGVPPMRRMFTGWSRSDLHRTQVEQIRALLGCSEAEFHRAVGTELATATSGPHAIASNLRYCPACLAGGFHSALFQHWAVSHCWRHGEPLLDRCFNCAQPIDTTFASAAASPFGCPHCGSVFFRGHGQPHKPMRSLDMPALRSYLSVAQAKATSMWVPESSVQQPSRRRRVAQHMGLWGAWRPPIERHCRLTDVVEDLDPACLTFPLWNAWRGVWSFLHKLYTPWAEEIAELERTMNAKIYWPTEGGRPGLSVVAASAVQLRYFYGAPNPHHGRPNTFATEGPEVFGMRGTPLVYSAVGNGLLYRYELLGLACALLIKAALEPEKMAERWCTALPREWYCPTWLLERRGGKWILRIRPRGSVVLLHWLTHRYRDRRVSLAAKNL